MDEKSTYELERIPPKEYEDYGQKRNYSKRNQDEATSDFSQAQLLDASSLENKLGIESSKVELLDEDEETSPWASLWIANIILLLGSIQFSIFFSSLWPYLQQLDHAAQEDQLGILIAGFSVGQLVASPLFGFWSNRMKQARIPVAAGVIVLIGSNFLYVFVEAFPKEYAFTVLLISRIISGVGAGNASVLRAYIATASTPKDRPKAIALGTAAFTLGYILGPGLQAVFGFIGFPGYVNGAFHLDVYTAPAYFANAANLLLLVLIFFKFHERYAGLMSASQTKDPFFVLPKYDKLAVGILIWAWFTLLFMGVNIETISAPYSMAMFDWSRIDAVTYNGIILSISAVISFVVYLSYAAKLSIAIDERKSIIFGIATIGVYYVITWPWPGLPGKLNFFAAPIGPNATLINSTATAVIQSTSTVLTSSPYANGSTPVWEWSETGCNPKYSWCYGTPPVPLWLYLGFWPLLSIGYPAATVAISTLFARVLGPRRQGTMQGAMLAAGSLSRTVGPLSISYVFEKYGPRGAWALCAILGLITLLPYPLVYKRLVPLQIALNPKDGSDQKARSVSNGEAHRDKF